MLAVFFWLWSFMSFLGDDMRRLRIWRRPRVEDHFSIWIDVGDEARTTFRIHMGWRRRRRRRIPERSRRRRRRRGKAGRRRGRGKLHGWWGRGRGRRETWDLLTSNGLRFVNKCNGFRRRHDFHGNVAAVDYFDTFGNELWESWFLRFRRHIGKDASHKTRLIGANHCVYSWRSKIRETRLKIWHFGFWFWLTHFHVSYGFLRIVTSGSSQEVRSREKTCRQEPKAWQCNW